MAARYMEFILYITNYKHGNGVNSEVTLSCLFYAVTTYFKMMFIKMKTMYLWLCTSAHKEGIPLEFRL